MRKVARRASCQQLIDVVRPRLHHFGARIDELRPVVRVAIGISDLVIQLQFDNVPVPPQALHKNGSCCCPEPVEGLITMGAVTHSSDGLIHAVFGDDGIFPALARKHEGLVASDLPQLH